MVRRLVLPVLVLTLAGCGGSGSKSLVLTPSDVGKDFREFDQGQQAEVDFSPPRDDPKRFGREDGWKARFTRLAPTTTIAGPLQISSLADRFRTAEGARMDFSLYQQWLGQFVVTGGRTLAPPGVGDEAAAVTYRQGLAARAVRYYMITWRDKNVTASVNVNGNEGKLAWQQALDLVRKQEKRIHAGA
ncbi:MAG: hypothetical protein E6G45_12280 [Actinobacteria bacterium]|nr:MAG: hypothetical protein E6G45_12280 [Actinomycetota bacterium]